MPVALPGDEKTLAPGAGLCYVDWAVTAVCPDGVPAQDLERRDRKWEIFVKFAKEGQ
jgi:hypothetical protein